MLNLVHAASDDNTSSQHHLASHTRRGFEKFPTLDQIKQCKNNDERAYFLDMATAPEQRASNRHNKE